jgi:hypothetical protein
MPLVASNTKKELTSSEQECLYEHYGVKLFYRIHSPLREEDNPSFSTYESNGNIRWKDFGTGEGGNIFDLIMAIEDVDFKDALEISREILKGSHSSTQSDTKRLVKNTKRGVVPFVSYRDFELEYWSKRGITEQQLIDNLVLPLKMLLIDDKFKCTSTKELPKFVYYMRPDKTSWKLYSPLDHGDLKWMSHNISSVNYESPVKNLNKDLIIFSSKKDKMVFDNLNLPYDTTSVLAEGNYKGIIKELEGDFKHYNSVYCLLDFDKAGERSTENIENESNGRIKGVYLTLEISNYLYSKNIKDLDEVVVNLGYESLRRLVNKIL